jgi:hypothetical protein
VVLASSFRYPERYNDPTEQALQLIRNLTEFDVKYVGVMLDVEGDKWAEYPVEENQQFMLELRAVFDSASIPLIMYTGATWTSNFGNDFTDFSDMPLIYAHYDNVPSFYDYDFSPYGGWTAAAGKQFFDGVQPEVLCDLPLDWDWSPEPFWRTLSISASRTTYNP